MEQKSGCALDRRDCSRLCTCIYTGILFWTASEQCRRFDEAGIKNGDVVLVNSLVYNAMTPKRGDIIAFKPNGRENAHYYIKRIVGLPGETVQIKDGKVYINGKEQKKISLCPKLKSRELPGMRSHLVRMSILYWEIRRPAAMTAGWLISEM